jgi:hypothetical protein
MLAYKDRIRRTSYLHPITISSSSGIQLNSYSSTEQYGEQARVTGRAHCLSWPVVELGSWSNPVSGNILFSLHCRISTDHDLY